MSSPGAAVSRAVLGRRLRSDRLDETLLPKRLALPVFCSDPLSSVAYATEQILIVLGLGGLAMLDLTPSVAVAVVALLAIVVASYRQTCAAYPNGGGAYAVSRANLGENAALTAAAALLIDYVLTVAVSVVAGVAAITSAVPPLAPSAVGLSLGFVVILSLVNLRGVRESGRVFAIPTYGFVACVFALLAVGVARLAFGDGLSAESADYGIRNASEVGGLAAVFLVLRAFASGCTALTGVEAVSNGVPAFQPPKSRNAAATLTIMGALAITMFAGITALAIAAHVHMGETASDLIGLPAGAEQKTALSQLGLAAFGHSAPFYLLQGFTAAILVLAANTAFNGFPVLASLLGRDQYMPHQLANRGDRLVFSNGIVVLAVVASLLIVAFDANVTRLIQLYILGVFLSFTLSQAGMVRHWRDLLVEAQRRGATRATPQAARQRARRDLDGGRLRDRPRHQVRRRGVDRRRRGADHLRDDEGDRAALRRDQRSARGARVRCRAAGEHPWRRPGLEPAGADSAGARLRPGDEPGDAASRARGRRRRPTTGWPWSGASAGVPVPLVVIESPLP